MSQIVCDEACQLVKQRHAALTSQIGAAQSQLAQLQQTHGSNSQVAASLQKVIQGLIQQRQIVAQQAKDLYDRLDAVKKEASELIAIIQEKHDKFANDAKGMLSEVRDLHKKGDELLNEMDRKRAQADSRKADHERQMKEELRQQDLERTESAKAQDAKFNAMMDMLMKQMSGRRRREVNFGRKLALMVEEHWEQRRLAGLSSGQVNVGLVYVPISFAVTSAAGLLE